MINISDLKKLDYNTRLKVAIATFVTLGLFIIFVFILSMKQNINKFNKGLEDVKNSDVFSDINYTMDQMNSIQEEVKQEIDEKEVEISNESFDSALDLEILNED